MIDRRLGAICVRFSGVSPARVHACVRVCLCVRLIMRAPRLLCLLCLLCLFELRILSLASDALLGAGLSSYHVCNRYVIGWDTYPRLSCRTQFSSNSLKHTSIFNMPYRRNIDPLAFSSSLVSSMIYLLLDYSLSLVGLILRFA